MKVDRGAPRPTIGDIMSTAQPKEPLQPRSTGIRADLLISIAVSMSPAEMELLISALEDNQHIYTMARWQRSPDAAYLEVSLLPQEIQIAQVAAMAYNRSASTG